MKALTLLLSLLPALISAQVRLKDRQPNADIVVVSPTATTGVYFDHGLFNKRTGMAAGLSFASGLCYGIHETVVHHPDRIPDGWNRKWWDASQSWRNKYRGGNPEQGPALPGY